MAQLRTFFWAVTRSISTMQPASWLLFTCYCLQHTRHCELWVLPPSQRGPAMKMCVVGGGQSTAVVFTVRKSMSVKRYDPLSSLTHSFLDWRFDCHSYRKGHVGKDFLAGAKESLRSRHFHGICRCLFPIYQHYGLIPSPCRTFVS